MKKKKISLPLDEVTIKICYTGHRYADIPHLFLVCLWQWDPFFFSILLGAGSGVFIDILISVEICFVAVRRMDPAKT